MKIVSKFTDYYDSVQSLGMDKSCVYVRKKTPVSIPGESAIMELIGRELDTNSSIFFYAKNKSQEIHAIKLEKFIVGYCGTLLLGYKFSHFKGEKELEANCLYHPQKASQYIEKFSQKFPIYFDSYMYAEGETKNFALSYGKGYQYIKTLAGTISDFFQELQTPVFLFPANILSPETFEEARNKYSYNHYYPEAEFLTNPRLKELEFFRYKDPYTCYQDIYQFLGGVLTKRESIDTKMTDLDKVNQHGFDEKYGFRNRPGSKKKRKKKKK